MAHIIRLRNAWDIERVESPNGCGIIRLTRHFGCSAGLKSAQHIWLAIENVVGRAAITLNGASLGEVIGSNADVNSIGQRCPAKFAVTTMLQPRNVLVVDVSADPHATDLSAADYLGSVQLEIE